MNRNSLHIALLACFTLLGPLILNTAVVLAQSGGYSGSFQRMGFGPRGMAIGNAMTAVTGEGVYGYYNPAHAAAAARRRQLDISTTIMEFDRNLNMANAHFHLPPAAGIGIYLLHAGVSDIDGRSSSGYHTGTLSTNEFQLGTQFGLRFHERIQGGIGLKLNMARYHEELDSATSFGIDLGLKANITDRITTGFVVQDLLASYQWHASELYGDDFNRASNHHFPVRLKTGTAFQLHETLLLATEIERRIHRPETADNAINTTFLRAGVSYRMHERFTFRSGIRIHQPGSDPVSALSAGFSIHLPFDRFSPSIDYTFAEETNKVANLHVFALRLLL